MARIGNRSELEPSETRSTKVFGHKNCSDLSMFEQMKRNFLQILNLKLTTVYIVYSNYFWSIQQLRGQNFAIFCPTPPAWSVFIPWAWTKTDIFWPPPPSSCPRSYWTPLFFTEVQNNFRNGHSILNETRQYLFPVKLYLNLFPQTYWKLQKIWYLLQILYILVTTAPGCQNFTKTNHEIL